MGSLSRMVACQVGISQRVVILTSATSGFRAGDPAFENCSCATNAWMNSQGTLGAVPHTGTTFNAQVGLEDLNCAFQGTKDGVGADLQAHPAAVALRRIEPDRRDATDVGKFGHLTIPSSNARFRVHWRAGQRRSGAAAPFASHTPHPKEK